MSIRSDDEPGAFGAMIRRARSARGLTQRALAGRLGVSQALLSAWESETNLPRPSKLPEIAAALGLERDALEAAHHRAAQEAEAPTPPVRSPDPASPPPMSVELLHAQARMHARRYGPSQLGVWALGADNLTVMKRAELLEKRWRENLLWGFDYTIVWSLDVVDEDNFATVLAILSDLERKVSEDWPRWIAAQRAEPVGPSRPEWLDRESAAPGRVNHYAISVYQPPDPVVLATYQALERAAAADTGVIRGRVRPYRACHGGLEGADAALTRAARRLIRQWPPESGMVIYRPLTPFAPAAANIRLMPVTQEIVERVAPQLEESRYWFWLSPAGARRIVNALIEFEAACDAAEAEAG